MKKRVGFSGYCLIISALSSALICGLFVYALKQPDHGRPVVILAIIIAVMSLSTLLYMPLSVSVDDEKLSIRRPLRIKCIPLADISGVRLCPPTMYGWFRERDLGKYFAYYVKASDCFLVTLKDGRKYMLGCSDAPDMADAIGSRLRQVR